MPQMELTGGGWTSTYGVTPAQARRMFPGVPTSVALTAAKKRLSQMAQAASQRLAGETATLKLAGETATQGTTAPARPRPSAGAPARPKTVPAPAAGGAGLPITSPPPGESMGMGMMGTSAPLPPLPESPTAGEPQPPEVSREPAPEPLESFVRSFRETPARAEWRPAYTSRTSLFPPKVEPPAPPPPEAIRGPVPVEGVTPAPAEEEKPAAPPGLPRGPGGFERVVPVPVGFALPTPERLAEIWREVTGRAPTEEEQRYFASPQFQRYLAGRIPMWMAADPIWRRFFQLVGLIRKRLEE